MKQIQQAAGLVFDPVVSGRVWLTDWYATYHTDNIDSDPITLTATERGHEELVVFDLLAPISGVPLISGAADDDGFVHSSLTDYPRGFGSYYNGDGPSFGDTTQIAECLSSPSRLVRVSSNRWNQVGGVTVSTDGGMSWTPVSGWNTQIKPLRVAMSATDPNNFVVVPLGGGQTSATNDGGKTFTRSSGLPLGLLSGDVWNWQFPLVADGKLGGVYYVFASGTVYKSTDGGATFTVAAKGLPASYEALVTVPGSAGDVWADFGDSGLYHSTDGAVSFSKLSTVKTAKLFAVGKRAPSGDYASLYLYGSLADGRSGIFRSIDEGLSWIEIGDPNVPIGDTPNCMAGSLQTFGLVFIGTNGRGIYYGKPD
jgi:xyloglucan-specific exo-beta-1,4-glucanase